MLDEPTTGLHFEDIRKLLGVLGRLVDPGNTVVVIEHNLDVIKTADWLIDMGPEGGSRGGLVIAEGTPEQIAATPQSYTGEFLRPILEGQEVPVGLVQPSLLEAPDPGRSTSTKARIKAAGLKKAPIKRAPARQAAGEPARKKAATKKAATKKVAAAAATGRASATKATTPKSAPKTTTAPN